MIDMIGELLSAIRLPTPLCRPMVVGYELLLATTIGLPLLYLGKLAFAGCSLSRADKNYRDYPDYRGRPASPPRYPPGDYPRGSAEPPARYRYALLSLVN